MRPRISRLLLSTPCFRQPVVCSNVNIFKRHGSRISVPTTNPTINTTTEDTDDTDTNITRPPLPRLPVLTTCPPPSTPPCCTVPPPPPASPIDTLTPLASTAPFYNTHLVLPTPSGATDWPPNIALSPTSLAGRIKALGRGILVTQSSLRSGLFVFPAGVRVDGAPEGYETWTDGELGGWMAVLEIAGRGGMGMVWGKGRWRGGMAGRRDVVSVLVCSHASRDVRCGNAAGPLVRQFAEVLGHRGLPGRIEAEESLEFPAKGEEEEGRKKKPWVQVACSSHLSGHKLAGNVVVYKDGWGAWYGRVGTEHVEAIVRETVEEDRLVGPLLRGVVGAEVGEEMV